MSEPPSADQGSNGLKAAITYIRVSTQQGHRPVCMHLFAALAEKERALISTRTRQALSAANALNARSIATARGGQWYAQSVANVLALRTALGLPHEPWWG